MENIKIIILAAGKSTRMKSNTPKALALLKGKPFLLHILDTLKSLNSLIEPIIVIGHKKEQIKKALGKGYVYTEQHEQLGTGHAVMSAKKAIKKDHDTVLVISTDQPLISKETIKKIILKHQKEKGVITMATALVPDFEDWRIGLYHFGRIVRNNKKSVKKIVEFKDASEKERKIKELNPAIYAFDAKWLWDNINKLKNENTQSEYYLTDLIKMACDQKKKIETVEVKNIIEAFQPNSREELELLENIIK